MSGILRPSKSFNMKSEEKKMNVNFCRAAVPNESNEIMAIIKKRKKAR